MGYRKPLVFEIYGEFFFSEEISDQLQFEIAAKFLEEEKTIETTPVLNQGKESVGGRTRYRIWSSDKRQLVQVFPNRVTYNYLPFATREGEYSGWDYYLSDLISVWEKVCSGKKEMELQKVSLCYIDKIDEIDDDDFVFGKYFNCSGKVFPAMLKETKKSTDIIIGNGAISEEDNQQIKAKLVRQDGKYYFQLDTLLHRYVTEENKHKDGIRSVFNDMHDNCNIIFEDIITDFMRETIMGGRV